MKIQVKTFGEQLEEARERLEDCSRCFQLLETAQENFEDDSKELEEFKKLAAKSENGKVVEIYKVRRSLLYSSELNC